MILETIRAWTDWLGNATYGVNTLTAGVPRDGGDSAPDAVTVVDETRDGATARRRVPDTVPVVMVRLQQVAPLDPTVGPNAAHRDGTVQLATLYAQSDLVTEKGNRNAYYVLRGVERSLAKFMDPSIAAANTARTRGNVTIYQVSDLQHITTFEAMKDTDVLGGLLVTFKVRDTAP